jgi:hypothetical protein
VVAGAARLLAEETGVIGGLAMLCGTVQQSQRAVAAQQRNAALALVAIVAMVDDLHRLRW